MENYCPFLINNVCIACFSKGQFTDFIIDRRNQINNKYCADDLLVLINRSA